MSDKPDTATKYYYVYDNDTGPEDDGFWEFWTIYAGDEKIGQAETEQWAKRIVAALAATEQWLWKFSAAPSENSAAP